MTHRPICQFIHPSIHPSIYSFRLSFLYPFQKLTSDPAYPLNIVFCLQSIYGEKYSLLFAKYGCGFTSGPSPTTFQNSAKGIDKLVSFTHWSIDKQVSHGPQSFQKGNSGSYVPDNLLLNSFLYLLRLTQGDYTHQKESSRQEREKR